LHCGGAGFPGYGDRLCQKKNNKKPSKKKEKKKRNLFWHIIAVTLL